MLLSFVKRALLSLAAATLPVLPAAAQTNVPRCGNEPSPTSFSRNQSVSPIGASSGGASKQITNPYTDTDQIITLPLAVHIVGYNRVSMAQIQSQIDVLNADFHRGALANPPLCQIPAFDALAADVKFQFSLCSVDSVYYLTKYSKSTGSLASLLQDSPPVDQRRFINVWVCDLDQIIGVSNFPDGPYHPNYSIITPINEFDGVAIDYTCFGTKGSAIPPFNLGHTLTHELGHYFGLDHIWGTKDSTCTNDDNIFDTPSQYTKTKGYVGPGVKKFDACTPAGDGIMWMNYMDYTDDVSLTMFSLKQKLQMRWTLFNIANRNSLLGSNNTCPTRMLSCVTDPYEVIPSGADNDQSSRATPIEWNNGYFPYLCWQDNDWYKLIHNSATPGGTIDLTDPWTANYPTSAYYMDVYRNGILQATSVKHFDVPAANNVTWSYTIRVYCNNNYHPFLPYRLLLAQPCTSTDEDAQFYQGIQLAPNKTSGLLCSYGDVDKWKLPVPAGSGIIQFMLTDLTKPYLLKLYDDQDQLIAEAPNNGNNSGDKIISYALPTPFTVSRYYYLKVSGFEDAFDPIATYKLSAMITPECAAEPADNQPLTAAPVTGQICSVDDIDRWLIKVPKGQTGTNSIIKANLTGLTLDYQLKLYQPGNSTPIATGTLMAGSLDKQITKLVPTPAVDTDFRLEVSGLNGTYSPTANYTLAASAAPDCVDPFEGANGNNSTGTATVVAVSNTTTVANLNAQMCPQPTDVDWYKFTAGTLSHNVRLTLSNIPTNQDFDMELYYVLPRPQGLTLLTTSANAGNTNETISYDPCFGQVYTYFVKVIAKNKGFSTGNYSLQVKLDGSYSKICPIYPRPLTGPAPAAEPQPLQLRVSPNPAAASVDLTLTNPDEEPIEGPVEVVLIDQLGREVLRRQQHLTAAGQMHLDITQIPAGLYWVRVNAANRVAATRLQILH